MPDTAPLAAPITATEAARARLAAMIAADGRPGLMFRISVSAGGCSGFQYHFDLSDTRAEDDRLFTYEGVTIVCDEAALDLIGGTEVDYVESLMGAHFKLANPNATAACGCGSSFAV